MAVWGKRLVLRLSGEGGRRHAMSIEPQLVDMTPYHWLRSFTRELMVPLGGPPFAMTWCGKQGQGMDTAPMVDALPGLDFYLFYCTPYGGRDTEYFNTCYKFHFKFGRLRGINLERNLVLSVISQTENGASNRNLLEPNLWRTIPTISPPVEPRSSFPNHIPSAQVYSSMYLNN